MDKSHSILHREKKTNNFTEDVCGLIQQTLTYIRRNHLKSFLCNFLLIFRTAVCYFSIWKTTKNPELNIIDFLWLKINEVNRLSGLVFCFVLGLFFFFVFLFVQKLSILTKTFFYSKHIDYKNLLMLIISNVYCFGGVTYKCYLLALKY